MTKTHKETKEKTSETTKNDLPKAAKEKETQGTSSPKEDETPKTSAEEVAHWKDVAMRAAAEADNIRKRAKIDVEKAHLYANNAFAKELLPVVDCLESALRCAADEVKKNPAAEGETFFKNLTQGVEMTHKQLISALEKQGIKKMDTLGKVFDPNLHKVVQEIEDKAHEAGTVLQELQTGYTVGADRVLREAMVIVSK